MKTIANTALASLLLVSASLYGEAFDSNDFASMEIAGQKIEDEKDSGPFSVHTNFDFIGSAKIDKHGFHHDHVTFSNVDVGAGVIVYYNKTYKEGINLIVDYDITKFKWKHNPYFDKWKYHTLTFGVAGFTSRACGWDWQAYIGGNFDTDHFDLEYSTYDILLWGRNEWCEGFGLNFGFVAETGMKADRVVPLIGIDWKINDKWQLNAVFPVNMALIYKIDCNWSAEIAGRIFTSRHRVGKNQPLSKGIWIYRSFGIEGGILYELGSFHANLHAGFTSGGRVKIANRHYRHSHRFDLDAAPYAGGDISYRF